jgi:hypothetical protein
MRGESRIKKTAFVPYRVINLSNLNHFSLVSIKVDLILFLKQALEKLKTTSPAMACIFRKIKTPPIKRNISNTALEAKVPKIKPAEIANIAPGTNKIEPRVSIENRMSKLEIG